jgi:8-oxo-dGTP diphosphatase
MKKTTKLTGEGQHLKNDVSNYSDAAYKSPSVTVDLVVMSIIDDELGVMLIKRKFAPYKDSWALPGGFVDINEDVDVAAYRELKEETGVDTAYLEQLYTFGKVGRDPRKRVITVAHFALIDYTKVQAIAGSDAKEVKWFKVSKLPTMAFDHKEIINKAVDRVRNKISYTNVGFELVPDTFTIPEIRKVFESVMGRELNPTNFRTKLLKLEILKETKEKRIQGKGQPAPVYTLDKVKFAKIKIGETLF